MSAVPEVRIWPGADKLGPSLNDAAAIHGHFAAHAPAGWAGAVIVLRQKWRRRQFETRLANMPPCLIGMEAWVGARRPWIVPRAADQGHGGRALKGDIN